MARRAKRSKEGFHLNPKILASLGVGIGVGAALLYAFWPLPSKAPVKAKPSPVELPAAAAIPSGSGKIAIVLDDWGYTLKQMPILESIHQPMTVAILPGLPYSTTVAQRAHSNGKQVILHQPMEAKDPSVPKEASTLSSGMSKEELIGRLDQSLATVPFAKGVNNHQGSKATADPVLMERVLGELKRRGLYFLDSYVTNQSVCLEVSRRLKLPFVKRAVFLDNDSSPAAIQQRVLELAKVASTKGQALGIGHDRPHTLAVLRQMVPALKKAGYTFVYASQLAQVPQDKK